MTGGVVLFGDEFGLDLAQACIPNNNISALVIDPNRPSARQWAECGEHARLVFHHPQKIRRAPFVRELANLQPVLGLIISYGRILWPELLSLFPNGVINLHFGILPEYRGANVLQWVIVNGEEQTAATLHYVDEEIDTGPVIESITVRIDDNDIALTLREKLAPVAVSMIKKWLPILCKKKVMAVNQDKSRARHWPPRTENDSWIDWSWSDERIRNLTRALAKPWPGALYTDRLGLKQTIECALSLGEVRSLRQKVRK